MTEKMKNLKKKTKRGLTLIEALLFLGIAAVVIVGAVVLYNSTSGSQRANQALTQINAYTTGFKSLYSGQSTYGTGDLRPAAINGGIAPSAVINDDELLNPWGEPTSIIADGNRFQIIMHNLPQDACVRILTAGLMSQGGVTDMWVETGTGSATTTAGTETTTRGFEIPTEPTPATAASACSDELNDVYMAVR